MLEYTAKLLFEHLAKLYQIALLKKYEDQESKTWIQPAFEYLKQNLQKQEIHLAKPLSKEVVAAMLAWSF